MCAKAVLSSHPHRSIRSFVRREGRMTSGQTRALAKIWPMYGLSPQANTQLNIPQIFGCERPCILEIGFGHGECLATMAAQYPHYHFLGVEVFRTGVGALCQKIDTQQLTNIRILQRDAVEVVTKHIIPGSIDGVHIFFSDPWPKLRHHKRRLVQVDFIRHICAVLKPQGYIHLATDWTNYAQHMQQVLAQIPALKPVLANASFCCEKPERICTRFEKRGQRLGHVITDLIYRYCSSSSLDT